MGFRKTPNEVYATAWEGYQLRCREEGYIALNQYCLTIGMKVQRLYEWLRRRKISLSDFQSRQDTHSFSGSVDGDKVSFCKVEMPKPPAGSCEAATVHAVDARFELRSGDKVILRGVTITDIAGLMGALNRGCDVGS